MNRTFVLLEGRITPNPGFLQDFADLFFFPFLNWLIKERITFFTWKLKKLVGKLR